MSGTHSQCRLVYGRLSVDQFEAGRKLEGGRVDSDLNLDVI